MSDRLAVSASLSVLIMAIYVLFGENVARMPLEPAAQFELSVPTPTASLGDIRWLAGARD